MTSKFENFMTLCLFLPSSTKKQGLPVGKVAWLQIRQFNSTRTLLYQGRSLAGFTSTGEDTPLATRALRVT